MTGDTSVGENLPKSSTDLDHALREIFFRSPSRKLGVPRPGALGEEKEGRSIELGVRVEERSRTDLGDIQL